MVDIDPTALTALLVSLVALLIALGQLLQQYFATADGYRRCQSQVMGLWATRTYRKFRWREFRFETFYAVPKISFNRLPPDTETIEKKSEVKFGSSYGTVIEVSGISASFENLMLSQQAPPLDPTLVSWIPLLYTLQHMQYCLKSPPDGIRHKMDLSLASIPVVTIQTRSWDFMPPEIIKPLALTTVSDAAILAKRLGMVWEVFEPDKGRFIAEGKGCALTSVNLMSVGTVLQFSYDPAKAFPFDIPAHATRSLKMHYISAKTSYIPSDSTDRMIFGLIDALDFIYEVDTIYIKEPIPIGTEEDVFSLMKRLTSDVPNQTQVLTRFKDLVAGSPGWAPGFSDILSMVARPARIKGLLVSNIPNPSIFTEDLLSSRMALIVFDERLREMMASNTLWDDSVKITIENVMLSIANLRLRHPPGLLWNTGHKDLVAYLDNISAYLDSYDDQWFLNNPDYETSVLLRCVMRAHLTDAVRIFEKTDSWFHAPPDEYYGESDIFHAELMHRYFDNLPRIYQSVLLDREWKRTRNRLTASPSEGKIASMWVGLIFRAILWRRIHVFLPGKPLPAKYYDSQIPLYIG